jgi:hypothetical protein
MFRSKIFKRQLGENQSENNWEDKDKPGYYYVPIEIAKELCDFKWIIEQKKHNASGYCKRDDDPYVQLNRAETQRCHGSRALADRIGGIALAHVFFSHSNFAF